MAQETKANTPEQDKARIIEEKIHRLISDWHSSFEQTCYGPKQTDAGTQK